MGNPFFVCLYFYIHEKALLIFKGKMQAEMTRHNAALHAVGARVQSSQSRTAIYFSCTQLNFWLSVEKERTNDTWPFLVIIKKHMLLIDGSLF